LSTNADIKGNQHRKLDIAGPGQKYWQLACISKMLAKVLAIGMHLKNVGMLNLPQ